MRPIKIALLLLVAMTLILTSCAPVAAPPAPMEEAPAEAPEAAPTTPPPTSTAPPAEAAPVVPTVEAPSTEADKYGGILRIGNTDLNTLDVQAVSQSRVDEYSMTIYEPLVERTQEGPVRPLLLKEWSLDDDQVTHHWKLQEGVVFHNGEKFNAEVVKWNIERKIEKKLTKYDLVPWAEDPIKVIDEYTLDVTLSRPFVGLYEILAQTTFAMYSPTFVAEVGDDGMKTQASGTGPFKVEEYKPNESLKLVKFDDYWQEGLPYLDGIQWTVIPDLNTRSLMLESGDLDLIVNISPSEFVRLETLPEVKTYKYTSSSAFYGALDSYPGEILESKKVRQAINYAIDKESMIDPIFYGMVTLNKSFVLTPTSVGYYANEPYPFDPEKAKALLEEDGWVDTNGDGVREKDGKQLVLKLLNREGAYAGDTEVPEILQSQLGDVGMKIEIVNFDAATFVSSLNKERGEVPEYDIIYFSTGTASGYARDTMRTIYRCDAWPPKYWNYGWYCNPEVDALIDKGNMAPTLEEANQYYADAQKMAWDDAAAIFFFDAMTTTATRDNVEGVISFSAAGIWNTKYAYFVE